MVFNKKERLEIFLERLGTCPAAASHDEAFNQLSSVLNDVEDEFSGVPFTPENWAHDGRMYPPQEDNKKMLDNGVARYRSRGHVTLVGMNGAIKIIDGDGQCLMNKPGMDGDTVPK